MNTGWHSGSLAQYDVIVIGAGHNGLVCATYLAKAGLRTLVLEQQETVGGACVTKPLFPECRVSLGACWYGMLRPQIISDLRLFDLGLDPYPMDPQVLALYPDGRHCYIWLDDEKTSDEIARFAPDFSSSDVAGFQTFNKYVDEVLDVISPLLLSSAPSSTEIFQRFSSRGIPAVYHEVFSLSIADMLGKFIKNDALKAALATSAISISNSSPFSPSTAYDLFYMLAAETRGLKKTWGFARGGMGSVTTALENAALSAGAEIRTECEVGRILIEQQQAIGVILKNGLEIRGKLIISNADPKRTFLQLVPGDCLSGSFREQVNQIQIVGNSSIMHLLLNGLPHFRGFDNAAPGDQHRGMIIIAPSLKYIDEARRDAKDGRISNNPILTMSMQSVTDESIAPIGKHVLSIFVQFTPYQLEQGSWDEARQLLAQRILNVLAYYIPNINEIIVDYIVFTPVDLEKQFGISGGHPEHGDMILNQLFQNRPVQNWANYKTPIHNLYLCGSGTHPGGTVTGAPGYNAAQTILLDLKR